MAGWLGGGFVGAVCLIGGCAGIMGTAIGEIEEQMEATAVVRVEAPAGRNWSGSIGQASKDGTGTEEFTVEGMAGIFSANAQKKDEGPWELKISIIIDGQEVDSAKTTAEYGMAQVTGSVHEWLD